MLKTGHVTASAALKRLVAFSARNRFYRSNCELGNIFIRANIEPIAREWEELAKTCTPAAIGITKSALFDNVAQILQAVADDMEQPVWDHLAGTTSAPFEAGEHGQIAVKVIDDRGNELMMVKALNTPL